MNKVKAAILITCMAVACAAQAKSSSSSSTSKSSTSRSSNSTSSSKSSYSSNTSSRSSSSYNSFNSTPSKPAGSYNSFSNQAAKPSNAATSTNTASSSLSRDAAGPLNQSRDVRSTNALPQQKTTGMGTFSASGANASLPALPSGGKSALTTGLDKSAAQNRALNTLDGGAAKNTPNASNTPKPVETAAATMPHSASPGVPTTALQGTSHAAPPVQSIPYGNNSNNGNSGASLGSTLSGMMVGNAVSNSYRNDYQRNQPSYDHGRSYSGSSTSHAAGSDESGFMGFVRALLWLAIIGGIIWALWYFFSRAKQRNTLKSANYKL